MPTQYQYLLRAAEAGGPPAGDHEGQQGRGVEVELLDHGRFGPLGELGEDRGDLLA